MEKSKVSLKKVQFKYQKSHTRYYYLTESSGYPSAEYQYTNAGKKSTGLVIPEPRTNSADLVQSSHHSIPVT